MTRLHSQKVRRVAGLLMLAFLATVSAHAQTSVELRAKYGEPQESQLKNGRVEVETFLVRPNILLTIKYTKKGQPCEALIKPVKGTSPKDDKSEHPAQGDYMLTADVIALINELVPLEQRGKRTGEGSVNGGDPEMKLNHPGCWGMYLGFYENVEFRCSTWCWGGTFSATIQWVTRDDPEFMLGKPKCRSLSSVSKQQS